MAAEAADSAPRDVSAVALFKTCIEGFNIVITSENFTEDDEQLCALVRLGSISLCEVLLTTVLH